MAVYSWLTLSAALAALKGRLNQWNLWTDPELEIYLRESLRHFNGLCEQWNTTYVIPNANGQWIDTGKLMT